MKLRFSPLIAGMSGRAADAVAASWKGRSYVRKYVVPANPNTLAQQAVRDSFAALVPLWRSMGIALKAWLDRYGSGYTMSGFNVFLSKCRALEQTAALIKPVPDNPLCPAPVTFGFAAGGAGIITCTWTDNAPADYTHMVAFARKTDQNNFRAEVAALKGAGTLSLIGLPTPGNYDCYGAFYKVTGDGPFGTSFGKLNQACG
jgi:hypothetical protein